MSADDRGSGDDPSVPLTELRVDEIRPVYEEALVARGTSAEEAARVVDALLDAELCEVHCHGVALLPRYLDALSNGRFRPQPQRTVRRTSNASTLIDADGGLGYLPAWLAVDAAAGHAAEHGIGLAGVRNVGDIGRLAYYAEHGAALGVVTIICQNTPPLLASPGSSEATNGNNPLAFCAPLVESPLFDTSFTPRSVGELVRRGRLGLPLPADWGYVDPSGAPVVDPVVALSHPMPAVGGAKGFGLVLLIDLLAGGLTGGPIGPALTFDRPEAGVAVIAIDPDVFGYAGLLPEALATSAEAVRSTGGRWPGDRSRNARERNRAENVIRVPTATVTDVDRAVAAAMTRTQVGNNAGGTLADRVRA